jgi:hypothetical protein
VKRALRGAKEKLARKKRSKTRPVTTGSLECVWGPGLKSGKDSREKILVDNGLRLMEAHYRELERGTEVIRSFVQEALDES